MKTSLITFAALLLTVSISAQQPKTKPATAAQPAARQANVQQQQAIRLISKADTIQYALGSFMGQWLIKNGFTVSNPALFNRGINDVLTKRPRLVTDSTIVPIVAAAQLSTQNERNRQMEAQLFAALKGKAGVGVLPDGIHYMVVKTGAGVRPGSKDTVVFNAVGVLPDGTEFENTFTKKQALKTVVSNLIPGLNESIQLMPEGSVWRIFIPSAPAYGSAGVQGLIPPYSALVFDISLVQVKR